MFVVSYHKSIGKRVDICAEVFFAKNYLIFFAIGYVNICYPGNPKLIVKEIKTILQSVRFLSLNLMKSTEGCEDLNFQVGMLQNKELISR